MSASLWIVVGACVAAVSPASAAASLVGLAPLRSVPVAPANAVESVAAPRTPPAAASDTAPGPAADQSAKTPAAAAAGQSAKTPAAAAAEQSAKTPGAAAAQQPAKTPAAAAAEQPAKTPAGPVAEQPAKTHLAPATSAGPASPQPPKAPPAATSASAPTAAAAARSAESLRRSGLYGWGLGIELPLVGLMTGVASRSRVGWGYNLGASVSWEVIPTLELRLYGDGCATQGARAPVRYNASGTTRVVDQNAEWQSFELGAGVAYLFRRSDSPITPYVGADGGVRFSGYVFSTQQTEMKKLTAVDTTSSAIQATGNYSIELGWTAALRGGVRLELTRWLQTLAELQLAYVPRGPVPVDNTLTQRHVHGVAENIVLARLTFSVRVAL